jgi:hypothetical protein
MRRKVRELSKSRPLAIDWPLGAFFLKIVLK